MDWLPTLADPAVDLGSLLLDNIPATLILAVAYILSAIWASVRLAQKHCKPTSVSFSRSFMIAVTAALYLRSFSFLAISILAIRTRLRTEFLERFVGSALGFGDWVVLLSFLLGISTYVSLSYRFRHHLFSVQRMMRLWRGLLVVISLLILFTGLGLYIAVFATQASRGSTLFNAIQLAISVLNIALSGGFLLSYLIYGLLLSGFPYRSQKAARIAKLSRGFLLFWTLCRVVYSAASFIFSSMVDQISEAGSWLFPAILVPVFIFADMLPCALSFAPPFFEAFLEGDASLSPADGSTEQGDGGPRDLLLNVEEDDVKIGAAGLHSDTNEDSNAEGPSSTLQGFQTARSTDSHPDRVAGNRTLSGFWHRWAASSLGRPSGGAGGDDSSGLVGDGGSVQHHNSSERRPQPSIPELF